MRFSEYMTESGVTASDFTESAERMARDRGVIELCRTVTVSAIILDGQRWANIFDPDERASFLVLLDALRLKVVDSSDIKDLSPTIH